jgi:hypothetical protein
MAKTPAPFQGDTTATPAGGAAGVATAGAAIGALARAALDAGATIAGWPGLAVATAPWAGAVVVEATLAIGGLKKTGPEHDTAIHDNTTANIVAKPEALDIEGNSFSRCGWLNRARNIANSRPMCNIKFWINNQGRSDNAKAPGDNEE